MKATSKLTLIFCLVIATQCLAETEIVAWGNMTNYVPQNVKNEKTAVSISSGPFHGVAVLLNGTTLGWKASEISDARGDDFTLAQLATYIRNGIAATGVIKAVCGGAHTLY